MFDIFVPVHGHLDLTARCIESIYQNTKTPFHLIIADDGDQNKDMASIFVEGVANKYPNVTLIHKDPPGFKTGNEFFNAAFNHMQTDYIATVMNSIAVELDWEIVPLDLLKNQTDVGIVGMKCLFAQNGNIESAGIDFVGYTPIDIGRDNPGHRLSGVTEVPACQWALAMLRKQAVVGNLENDTFFGHVGWDDIDNCLTVKKKGWKILYCGVGVGYHTPRATRGSDTFEANAKNLVNSHIFYKRNNYWDLFLKTCPVVTLDQQVEIMQRGIELLKGEDRERVIEDLREFKKARKLVRR